MLRILCILCHKLILARAVPAKCARCGVSAFLTSPALRCAECGRAILTACGRCARAKAGA